MGESNVTFSVFTKPWKLPLLELGKHVRNLGFTMIELPVRPGYPILPENVARDLAPATRQLNELGIKISSVAGPTDEATIAACAEAGIPILRICVGIGDEGYRAGEARLRRELDELLPLLERYGVRLGIQNHSGHSVSHAMGLRNLIESYDPLAIGAVWDAAHNALQGEPPEFALDIIWPHLCMVNLKNAYWKRISGPEAEVAQWQAYWTNGRQGLASWPRVVAELKRREYKGVVCLTAEYSDERAVDRLIVEDLAFARSLFQAE